MQKFILFAFLLLLAACATPLKQGKKSFDRAEYQTAIQFFEQARKKGESPARTNALLAEAYRLSNRIREAEPYYQAALTANANEEEVRFYYGYALKANGKYAEARQAFERYANSGGNTDYVKRAKQEVKNLAQIDELRNRTTYYKVIHCPEINTDEAEFAPVLYQDRLLFSSTRKEGTYAGTGQGFAGIYAFDFTNEENCQGTSQIFSPQLSRGGTNEASPTFARDGSFVVFARSSRGDKGESDEVNLYISRNTEAGWAEAEILPYPVNISEKLYDQGGLEQLRGSKGEAWTSCPSITPDGKRIYFASNRAGGYGGTDIWVADINAGGRISGVRNLGNTINTPGDELFPFVSDEGVLYFASNGHPGLGGLDLFEAIREGGKTMIKNMGAPLNSPADDFALVWKDERRGYFSSNREGSKGDDDIYQFIDETPETKTVNYFLAIEVVGFDPNDPAKKEYPLSNARLDFLQGTMRNRGEKLHNFTADEQGKVGKFPIQLHQDYLVLANAGEEYFKQEVEYTTRGKAIPHELLINPVTDTTLYLKITLEKIVVTEDTVYVPGKELEINFDFNKADIRPDAAVILDEFAIFLKENPQVIVELSSHTDAVGTDYNNELLSQRRAESTVDYLVEKGIEPDRLKAKGYGERFLKIQTQEAEEQNRRTEFRVIGIKR
ncbi:MAG: OmpA family protein [Microscillaceae bacterium]|nr:OmpA family protein [Microscillaceae bacterium]